jgi:hypothetical protein
MSYLRVIAAAALSAAVLTGYLSATDSATQAAIAAPSIQTAATTTPGNASSGVAFVDRIMATVNQDPVLASDVEDAAHIEALLQGKPATEIVTADLRAAMERLIDRTLLRQQMPGMTAASDKPARDRIADIRAALPGAKSEAKWSALLAAYGIDEQKLGRYLQDQFELMQFVDARLRPSTDVSWNEIQGYYNEKLLPELKQRGAAVEPLRSVQDRIREILLQQKIDAQLSIWLASLREQGRVSVLQPSPPMARGAGSGGKGTSFSILDGR